MKKQYMSLIGVIVAAFCLFAAQSTMAEPQQKPALQQKQAPLKVYDDWGGDFSLIDHNGFPLNLSDFAGKVVLLSFGYTHCPDICPSTMFTMKRVIKALGDDSDKLQVLFITLDPERDNADRLRAFVEYFDPGFIALTGAVDDITQIAKKYGTKFEKEEFDEEGNYSIAHNAIIYLIDQQGRIRTFFRINASAQDLAGGVRRLLIEE